MKHKVTQFITSSNRVLIMSYEGVLLYENLLKNKIDLLICDEGHRLKNTNIKLFRVLNGFKTSKRILMTGTPLQNNLEELFACISFVNPVLFPSEQKFKQIFIGKYNPALITQSPLKLQWRAIALTSKRNSVKRAQNYYSNNWVSLTRFLHGSENGRNPQKDVASQTWVNYFPETFESSTDNV